MHHQQHGPAGSIVADGDVLASVIGILEEGGRFLETEREILFKVIKRIVLEISAFEHQLCLECWLIFVFVDVRTEFEMFRADAHCDLFRV